MFGKPHGVTGTNGPLLPFSLQKISFPLNYGRQAVAIGAGGPQGVSWGRAGHRTPWPYITGFINFISGMPYGTASTLANQPNYTNLWSGANAFRPLGYEKPMTGSYVSF